MMYFSGKAITINFSRSISTRDIQKQYQTGLIDEKRMKQLLREQGQRESNTEEKPFVPTNDYSKGIGKLIKEIEPEYYKKEADKVELEEHFLKKTGDIRAEISKEKIEKTDLKNRFKTVERVGERKVY